MMEKVYGRSSLAFSWGSWRFGGDRFGWGGCNQISFSFNHFHPCQSFCLSNPLFGRNFHALVVRDIVTQRPVMSLFLRVVADLLLRKEHTEASLQVTHIITSVANLCVHCCSLSQNHISCSVSAYKTMNLLGLTRVQAKYFFYHSVAAITPAVPTIPLPLFYLCYRAPHISVTHTGSTRLPIWIHAQNTSLNVIHELSSQKAEIVNIGSLTTLPKVQAV